MDAADTLAKVIAITSDFRSDVVDDEAPFSATTAICQDAMIFGVDVEDYVWRLEEEFGSVVWKIPWLPYTDQTFSFRGCGCLAIPFVLVWRLVVWPVTREKIIPRADPANFPHRLTLGHIAAVIDKGEWFDP